MMAWFEGHEVFLVWTGIASVVMFVGTILAIPFMVAMIPEDYFAVPKSPIRRRHSFTFPIIVRLLLRNICGVVLVMMGAVMLALPGQGIITMLVGLILMEFPGKYALERRIISIEWVRNSVNWIRAKRGKPHLKIL